MTDFAGTPKLSLTSVGKVFRSKAGEVEALRGIDLELRRGEFVAMVGPSGCGKTTTLNIIAGLEEPDEGEVQVDGRRIKGPGPDRTVMFQESALFPWLTVRQNVEFGLALKGVSRRQRCLKAQEYLKLVNLTKFASSYVHELSGGMRQRVALARALALEPEVLLMDEPFAALDAQSRETLTSELEHLWKALRMTVVFVTHHVPSGVQLAERVLVFGGHPGQVLAEYAVDLPRPRLPDDPDVLALSNRITETFSAQVRAEQESFERELPHGH